MSYTFDGRYDYTKPWVTNQPSDAGLPPMSSYNGPWASNMERLTQQALMAATIPGAQLQEMVRPPIPQIRLFPDRFGFGNRLQPDINDVVSLDRVYTEPRVSWYSGSPAGYSGASRNSLESI
jgi:hypothetical protein